MTNTTLSRPRFGEIMFADLPVEGSVQGGMRPVLIVQNDKGNQHSSTVEVLPLTTRIYKGMHLPTHVIVDPDDENRLTRTSMILGENVLTIPMYRLVKSVGFLSAQKMLQVAEARRIQSPLPFRF